VRTFLALTLAALTGCASAPKSRILQDAGEFPHHRNVGVAPFADPRGKGKAVADAIEDGLQLAMYEPVDEKALQDVLARNMPDRGSQIGLEALEKIKAKVPVDAIIFGRIAPDWSLVLVTVNETEMGAPILQLALRPASGKKSFSDPAEIAKETLRVLGTAGKF
jgi:hypothetical protein